ncbi:MAG: hypothetical protein AAGF95_16925 [Chloroflexota bacterium]
MIIRIRRPGTAGSPDPAAIRSQVLDVYDPTATVKRQASHFQQVGLCQGELQARAAARALHSAEKQSANDARAIVLAALAHGWVGLVTHAAYSVAPALCLLQTHVAALMAHLTTPLQLLEVVRRDVTVLYHVLHHISDEHPAKRQRPRTYWLEQILHAPPGDPLREQYRQRFVPSVQTQVIQLVAHQRSCDGAEARMVLTALVNGGLAQLITWRAQDGHHLLSPIPPEARVLLILEPQLVALPPAIRAEIRRLVVALAHACHATGSTLPLPRLLREPPSSRYRRRLGRRLAPVLGPPRRSGQRPRRRQGVLPPRRRVPPADVPLVPVPRPDDDLVVQFAQYAGFSAATHYQEARTRLRHFITYGVLGLIPKSHWHRMLDARVGDLLYFFKLAYPSGTVDWTHVLACVHAYAHSLGVPPPSSQLAQGVSNSYAKPTRWHGGDGPAVRQVRQRQTLILTQPRLHEQWMVLPVTPRLPLPLLDDTDARMSPTCHVLLVLDMATVCPVGYWISATPPQSTEVGLALYQAIWHPGALSWPLRGVPTVIHIPTGLVPDGAPGVYRAATWLGSTITLMTRRMLQYAMQETLPVAATLTTQLVEHFPAYARETTQCPALIVPAALEALRTWLHPDDRAGLPRLSQNVSTASCFPAHTAPDVPLACRRHGVALPGSHTPAAGWLLPVMVHPATTAHDGVQYRGGWYTDQGYHSVPGDALPVRMFPPWYPQMTPGLFIETDPHGLRYLVQQP